MATKRKLEKAKKAQKAHQITLEKKVNETFKEGEAGKSTPQSMTIPAEQRNFPGPKPKPPKKKTLCSGKQPPIPPPQLLDLLHNFLKDFKYIKSAHGVRTDNQKRPGHNLQTWKWTSNGMPNLLEIFLQWQEQNPGRGTALGGDDPTPKRTERMALGVYGTEPQIMSNKSAMDEKKTRKSKGRQSSSSPSSSGSASDDDSSSEGTAKVRPLGATESTRKRKITDVSSDDLDSDESATSAHDTSSSSSSGPESDSNLESESEYGLVSEDSERAVEVPVRKRIRTTAEDLTAKAASTQLLGKKPSAEGSETKHKSIPPPAEKSLPSAPSPDSSSDDSSDEDDSSDDSSSESEESEDNEESLGRGAASKVHTPQFASSVRRSDSAIANGHSDSSATLPKVSGATAESQGDKFAKSSTSVDSSMGSSKVSPNRLAEPSRENALSRENVPFKRKLPSLDYGANDNTKRIKKPNEPFSRIPKDLKVEDKFSSNEYRPYDYADLAHRDLSVTKGKGFTKEKNKKKRGQGFRGGVIDIEGGRSIKFDD